MLLLPDTNKCYCIIRLFYSLSIPSTSFPDGSFTHNIFQIVSSFSRTHTHLQPRTFSLAKYMLVPQAEALTRLAVCFLTHADRQNIHSHVNNCTCRRTHLSQESVEQSKHRIHNPKLQHTETYSLQNRQANTADSENGNIVAYFMQLPVINRFLTVRRLSRSVLASMLGGVVWTRASSCSMEYSC